MPNPMMREEVYQGEPVVILVDFNACFIAVMAPKEHLCYGIAEAVDWNWGDPE